MKRLFFLAVLLGTMILTGIFAFSYWRLKTKTPESYFELGKKYYEQGKLSEAQIEFLNALKRDANHRNSRYYLALSYIAQQDPLTGYKQLKALLEANPDDVEANLTLGNLYVKAGTSDAKYYDEAISVADVVLAKTAQKNIPALVLKGNALAGKKDFLNSVKNLKDALALDPKNVSTWITLGGARVLEKNFPEAEKAFLGAREADRKDRRAYVSLANFYRVAGKPDKAELVFTEALSLFPGEWSVYSGAAEFYLNSGRLGVVERVLKDAQAVNSKDPAPTILLAEIYRQKKRDSDALALLLDAKTGFPDSIPLAIKLAGFLIPQKPDQARREIDQILKANKTDPAGLVLLGELEFSTGNFDKAEQILASEPGLGRSFPQVHYLLGRLALRSGKLDEAQDHYQQAVRLDKTYLPALIAIANVNLVRGNIPEARQYVRQVLEIDPANISGRLIKSMVDGAEKKDAAAEVELSNLLREYPNNAEIHHQMGNYWVSRNKNAAAEKSFVRALELEPKNEQTFKNLTLLYAATNQIDRAREKLSAVPNTEKKAFHYELVGMVAEQERRPQEAEVAYKKALEIEPNRSSAESLLFNLYLRSRRLEDAISQLDDLAKRRPADALVFGMKAAVNEAQENLPSAEENYRKAVELDPTLDFAANNLAYLLVKDGRDLQTAQTLAEGGRRRQPQNPTFADTLGWIYFRQGLLVLARDQAEFAVSQQPDNGTFQYHLGQIYKESKEPSQIPKAIAALKKAAGSSTDFKEKELAQADLRELQKRPTTAKP